MDVHSFANLPGVKGQLRGPIVRTVTGVMQALREHRICAMASDNGAIEVWRDDAGLFHAHLVRHHVTVKETTAKNRTGLYGWLVYAITEMKQAA